MAVRAIAILEVFMKQKTRILFICHGNICRSPMAEFIMKELVRKAGLEDRYEIASAATSAEELGNPVYPPARRELASHGISCKGKTARQITRRDYDDYDYLIAMEQYNLRNIRRIIPEDPEGKISLLMEHAGLSEDIEDPWYTGNFSGVYRQIERGCAALLQETK